MDHAILLELLVQVLHFVLRHDPEDGELGHGCLIVVEVVGVAGDVLDEPPSGHADVGLLVFFTQFLPLNDLCLAVGQLFLEFLKPVDELLVVFEVHQL